MSRNENTELDEGAGRRGGWGPALYVATAAAAAGYLLWHNHKAKKRTQEMEFKLMRNSVYIHRSQMIPFIEYFSTISSPPEERGKVVHTGCATRGIQFFLSELDDLEDLLVERQHLYCSYFKSKSHLEKVEKKIRETANILIWYDLLKKEDLDKVLSEDRHCGSCLSYLLTGDKRKNGKLMWEMLEGWRYAIKKNVKDKNFKKVFEDKENLRSSFQ